MVFQSFEEATGGLKKENKVTTLVSFDIKFFLFGNINLYLGHIDSWLICDTTCTSSSGNLFYTKEDCFLTLTKYFFF